jgi:hypothetical protein
MIIPPLGIASWLRIGSAVVVVAALASSHWWAYTSGREQVQLRWDADVSRRTAAALEAEQLARTTEQLLQSKVRKVANDYAAEKRRRAVADSAAADSLRRLESVLAAGDRAAGRDPAATARVDDDPRNDIIAECGAALRQLDAAHRALVGQTAALQGYAGSVCVSDRAD